MRSAHLWEAVISIFIYHHDSNPISFTLQYIKAIQGTQSIIFENIDLVFKLVSSPHPPTLYHMNLNCHLSQWPSFIPCMVKEPESTAICIHALSAKQQSHVTGWKWEENVILNYMDTKWFVVLCKLPHSSWHPCSYSSLAPLHFTFHVRAGFLKLNLFSFCSSCFLGCFIL